MNRLALFVLLLFAGITDAQSVSVYCPSMPINRLSLFPNVWECAREIGTAQVKMPDGKILNFRDFEIAPTLVRKHLIGHIVDSCNQFGYSDNMDQLSIDLRPERVILGVAERMRAPLTMTMHDGRVFTGSVVYPRCKSHRTGLGQREAAEVWAYGSFKTDCRLP